MPLYELTLKDGSTVQVEGPENASTEQLISLANRSTPNGAARADELRRQRFESMRSRIGDEEAGLLDYLGEVPKGLAAGAAGLVESAALGAAAPLAEKDERAAREAIQDVGRGVQEYLAPDAGLEDSIPRKFSEALGSFGALGVASLIPGVGLPLAGGLAVGAGAGEASERARKGFATEEERATATGLGAVVGAAELLPIKFIKSLGRPTTGTIVDRVKRAGASGGVEGAQEAAAEIAQNLIEQGVYNPEQGTFTNTGESAAYGAGVGAFVQAIVDLALPGRQRGVSGGDELLGLPAPEERLGLPAPEEPTPLPPEGQRALPAPEERLGLEGPEELLGIEQQEPTVQITMPDGSTTEVPRSSVDAITARAQAQGIDVDPTDLSSLLQAEAQLRETTTTEAVMAAREQGREEDARGAERARQTGEMVLPQAEEQARARLEDEQEMFPLERERAEAEPRREEAEPRAPMEQMTLEGVEERELQGEMFGPRGGRLQRPTFEERPSRLEPVEPRQEELDVSREEQLEMFGPRGGVRRQEAAPETTPRARERGQQDLFPDEAPQQDRSTQGDLFTDEGRPVQRRETQQELFPETTQREPAREMEQAEMFGPRGGVQRQPRAERRTATESGDVARRTATESGDVETRPVTAEQLDAMAIPKAAPVRRRVQGRNLSNTPDQEFVRDQLTTFANQESTKPETKFRITKFLEGTADEQLEMFGPRGGLQTPAKAKAKKPTERGRDAEPQRPEPTPSRASVQTGGRDTEVTGATADVGDTERVEPSRPDRLERAERDVADVADREGAVPSTLEAPAKPKKKAPKRKRKTPVEVLDTARGKKPTEKAKAEPTEKAKAERDPKAVAAMEAKAREIVEEAKPEAQKTVEKTKPKTQESAKATAKRTTLKVASEAEIALDEAQKNNVGLYDNPIYNAPFKKVTKVVATDKDKRAVASLLSKVTDPLKSGAGKTRKAPLLEMEGVLPEGTKTRNLNAVRMYFGKKKRVEDVIELIAYDLAAGASGQGSYQAQTEANTGAGKKASEGTAEFKELPDITPADEKAYFQGLGNAKAARAAYSWVLGNLSSDVRKLMATRATHYAEIELAVDTIGTRDLIEEDRARAEKFMQLREEAEEQALKPSDDKLSKAETRKLEKAFEEGVDSELAAFENVIDAIATLNFSLDLPSNAVVASEIPLHPEVETALQEGSLAIALQRLATTTLNKHVRNAANKFLNVLGTTKVEVVEDLENDAGKSVAGFFDPATNTIKLNAETGMTPHALLHELGHMATADTLRNPSHPLTKQITKLFNDVKDRLDTAYGAQSVDEFAAEAQSNAEFRALLSRITPKGETVSALEKFNHSVMNFLRRLFGMQTKPMDSALTQADMLIESILSPAAPSVNAEKLYLNTTRAGVLETMKNLAQDMKAEGPIGKKFANDLANSSVEFLTSTAPRTAKNVLIRFKDAVSLAQTGEELGLGRVGMDLYNLMNRQRGKIHAEDEKVRAAVQQLAGWRRKSGLKKREAFSRVVYSPEYGSTLYQVDPNLSKAEAEKKYKNDPDKMRVWQAQRADWNAIGTEGQKQYNAMLAFYRKKYKEFKEVIDGQLDSALKNNPEAAKRLKNELFEKFFKNLELEIYAPLTRTGRYKVTYELKPEATPQGRESYVVEMRDTKKERKQLIAQLRDNPNVVQSTVTQVDGELKLSNFKKAPPTSFVYDVVKVLEANGVKSDVIEEIGRTFIEALPETSLAKSMQRRKNVLGYVQDPVQAMRTKGYDLSRQIERMRFNALLVDIENKIGNITTPTHAKIQAARKAFPKLSKEELAKELETSVGYIDSVDEIYKGATTNAQKDRAAEQVGELIEAVDGVKAEMQDRARFSRAGAKNKNVEPYVKFFNQNAFLFTIGFNPSSAAVQLAQVPMFVYPYLGADYGYRASASAINKASRVVGALNNDIERYYDVDDAGNFTLKQSEVDAIYSKAKNKEGKKIADEKVELLKDLQALTQAASEFGLLNRSYILDAMGLEESGRKTNIMDLLVAGSAYMFNHTERMNRQVTLVSSYKLELDRLRKNNPRASDKELQAQAVKRAIVLTQELNGGAVLETGPSITREGLGRVAGMYKTYGLRMYATMMKSAKQFAEDAKKKGVPAAMTDTAFKQLLGIHGSAILFAGVHGVPLYGAVQLFADLFLLGEDEDDFNTLVRKATGETWYKGIVNQITGMDIASRVRLTGLLIQENRYNTDPSPEEWLGFYFGGPALSVGKRLVSGVENIAEGEYTRGAELLMPAGVTNMYKTTFGRYQESGGIYTRRQDPIYADMGTGELMAQFFGFPPAEYTFRQEVNQRDKRVEGAVLTERTKLLRKYYVASRMGDYDELMDVMEKINKFNSKHSNVAITNDTVNKSMKKHAETSANMYDGVTISPLMRFAIEQSRMEYDNSFSLF